MLLLLLVLIGLACCTAGAPTPNKHVIDELNKIFSNLDDVKWNNPDRVERLFQGLWKDLKPLKTQELSFTDDEKLQIAEIIRSIRSKRFPKPAPAQERLKNLIAMSMKEIRTLFPEVPLAAQSRARHGSSIRSIPSGHAPASSKPQHRFSTTVNRMPQKNSKSKQIPKSTRSGSQSSDTCSLDSVTSPRTVLRDKFLKDSLHRAEQKRAKLDRSSSLHSISEDSSTVDDFKSFTSECKADAHFVAHVLDVKDLDPAFTDEDPATAYDKNSVSQLDCSLDGPALLAKDSDSVAPLIEDDTRAIFHQDHPESKLHIDASVHAAQASLPSASSFDHDVPAIVQANASEPDCLSGVPAPGAKEPVAISSLVDVLTDVTSHHDDSHCELRSNTGEPLCDAEAVGPVATLDDDCIVDAYKDDSDSKLHSHADETVPGAQGAALEDDRLYATSYEKGSSSKHNDATTLQDRDSIAPSSASDHPSCSRDDSSYLSSFLITADKVCASSSTFTENEATQLPSASMVYSAYNNPLFDDGSFYETMEAGALNPLSSALAYEEDADQLVKYHSLVKSIADETNTVSGLDLESEATDSQSITSPDHDVNLPGGFMALESEFYDREVQISQVTLNDSTDCVNQVPLADPPACELHSLDDDVASSTDPTKNACESLSSGSDITPGAIQDEERCCQEVALPSSISFVIHQERSTQQSAAESASDLLRINQDEEASETPSETTCVCKAPVEALSDASHLKQDEETVGISSATTDAVHQEQFTNQAAAADLPAEGDLSSSEHACCEAVAASMEDVSHDESSSIVKRDWKICWKTVSITSATTLGVVGAVGAVLRLLFLRYRWRTESISV